MSNVGIVLLNWNGKKLLKDLPSVTQYSQGANIYIIDNASSDESISFIKENYSEIKVIQLNKNYGFCIGYNLGLKEVKEEFYVLLNTDIEVTKDWLKKPIEILQKDTSVAICQPKILDWKDKQKFEYAGAAGGIIDRLGYPFCRGRVFENIEKDEGQFDDIIEVFWATGACLFIRGTLFHEIKGFDSGFFAHMEEIDLCWRVKNLGYKIIYCGQSTVYHVGGATLMKSNPKKTFLNFRNSLLYLVKNLPAHKYLPKILCRLVLDGVAACYFLSKGEPDHFRAVFNAHISFYYRFWRYLNKLKVKKDSKAFHPIYKGSIVFSHYVKRKKKIKELNNLKFPEYRLPS